MKIDLTRMFLAVSNALDTEYGQKMEAAYLNRKTGDIEFLYEEEGFAEVVAGKDVAVDNVFDRAAIEASPDEWLEIPKYDRRSEGVNNEEAFIYRFLKDHGIDPKAAGFSGE